MAVYEYKAIRPDGRVTRGVIDADTPGEAVERLRIRGIYVTNITSVEERFRRRRMPLLGRLRGVSMSELAVVTRQFATLVRSGVPLAEALQALTRQTESQQLQTTLRDVREKVTQGMSLADALALHPQVFSDLYVNMVRAGEASGTLDAILARLADYLQKQYRLVSRIWAALTYPIMMVCIGTGVVLFLMTYLIPKVLNILKARNQPLPQITLIVKAVSDFILNYWPFLIVGVMGLVAFLSLASKTKTGKKRIDSLLLKLPIVGGLFRKQAVSRFSMTMSILLRSGLPVIRSLEIVRDLVGNEVVKEAIDDIREKVTQGADVSTVMQRHTVFPPVVSYMVAVGEKAGSLEEMLEQVAESYDDELEIETQRLTSLIEPVMIITLAVVVAFIIVSVLIPLMEMSRFK